MNTLMSYPGQQHWIWQILVIWSCRTIRDTGYGLLVDHRLTCLMWLNNGNSSKLVIWVNHSLIISSCCLLDLWISLNVAINMSQKSVETWRALIFSSVSPRLSPPLSVSLSFPSLLVSNSFKILLKMMQPYSNYTDRQANTHTHAVTHTHTHKDWFLSETRLLWKYLIYTSFTNKITHFFSVCLSCMSVF